VSDARFRDLLGVRADASREEIRRNFRRRVMENHPDRFPPVHKPSQELRLIALNEAYAALRSPVRGRSAGSAPGRPTAPAAPTGRAARGAVGPHRDPAYAYYKQGFLSFSLAVHGIAETDAKVAAARQPTDTQRYEPARDVAGSLGLLADAHRYFSRVVERHPDSVWAADAEVKLRRIARFTRLYQTILANISSATT
jgi:curved DNA-binding protein CbpA